MKVLLVDIGNTSATLAVASSMQRVGTPLRVTTACRARRKIETALQRALGRDEADGAVLCSVVPSATALWERCLRAVTGQAVLVVGPHLNLGVGIDYPRPECIGPDRLANAAAGIARFGAPVIVADFGTALTFDVVSAQGDYIGGVIAPGLPLMTDYLHQRTALLPQIELKGACGTVGRSTAGAMRIGARVGYRGIVHEITAHLRTYPGMADAALCATGGFAGWALAGSSLPYVMDSRLTLRGLFRIYQLNAS